jgi:hypothetical protein
MPSGWPETLAAFEAFLKEKGLYCQLRGPVPRSAERYGEKMLQYTNDKITVRIVSESSKGSVEIADIALPDEWYDAALLRDLFKGRVEDRLPVSEEIGIIEDNWLAITDAFSDANRETTHTDLKLLRNERAKRLFPGYQP